MLHEKVVIRGPIARDRRCGAHEQISSCKQQLSAREDLGVMRMLGPEAVTRVRHFAMKSVIIGVFGDFTSY